MYSTSSRATSASSSPASCRPETADTYARVRDALADPAFYPDPPEDVAVIDTHTSCVFLAGDLAYKLKKPVRFGFLDYGSAGRAPPHVPRGGAPQPPPRPAPLPRRALGGPDGAWARAGGGGRVGRARAPSGDAPLRRAPHDRIAAENGTADASGDRGARAPPGELPPRLAAGAALARPGRDDPEDDGGDLLEPAAAAARATWVRAARRRALHLRLPRGPWRPAARQGARRLGTGRSRRPARRPRPPRRPDRGRGLRGVRSGAQADRRCGGPRLPRHGPPPPRGAGPRRRADGGLPGGRWRSG